MSGDLRSLLTRAAIVTGQKNVSLRVDCDNLETVFVEQASDGRLLVFDRWYVWSFLTEEHADNYRTIEEIGVEEIQRLCVKNGVDLLNLDPVDPYSRPAIGVYCGSDSSIQHYVESLSTCIDEVFSLASKL